MQFVIWNGVVQQGMNGHADIRRRTSLSLVITHQDDMLMAVVCSLSFVSIHNSYSHVVDNSNFSPYNLVHLTSSKRPAERWRVPSCSFACNMRSQPCPTVGCGAWTNRA